MAEPMHSPESEEDASTSRLFQCRICARSFAKNEHLGRHVRSHTKERPYKCLDCGKTYSRRDILIRHQRDVKCKNARNNERVPSLPSTDAASPNAGRNCPAPRMENTTSNTSPSPVTSQAHGMPPPLNIASEQQPSSNTAHGEATHEGQRPYISPALLEAVDLAIAPTETDPNTLSLDAVPTPQIPSFVTSTFDVSDYSQWWNVNAGLHDDIWGVNLAGLENDITGITGFAEPQLASVQSMDLELERARGVQRLWSSPIPDSQAQPLYPQRQTVVQSGYATEPGSPGPANTEVDDLYRQKLQRRLQILPDEPTVPSVDLLNIAIRLYFTKVHPIFPVIHAPTFRPSRHNRSLLIGMCALGSLYTGSDQGLRQGIHLFERIHKSTILNWEHLVAKNHDTMVSIIQCALISQLFGLLSGIPNLLLTVDAFHGPPIAWARQLGLQKARDVVYPEAQSEGPELEEVWRKWAREEELIRLAHGLYIIDVEIASTLHHEPLQNFDSYDLSITSSDRMFMAHTSRHWKEICLAETSRRRHEPHANSTRALRCGNAGLQPMPASSSFTAYAILESFNMKVLVQRAGAGTTWSPFKSAQDALTEFHRCFLDASVIHDTLHLRILLHAGFMAVYTDFNLLERAVGREGATVSNSERETVTGWANSEGARRSLLHGIFIGRCIQEAAITAELAAHVPRCLFWAGIAIACYLRFAAPEHLSHARLTAELTDPGNPLAGIESSILVSDLSQSGLYDGLSLKMTLCMIADTLRHSGRWEVSRKYAAILTLISDFSKDK